MEVTCKVRCPGKGFLAVAIEIHRARDVRERWWKVVRRLLHVNSREDWARYVMQHLRCNGADKESPQHAQSMRRHCYQVHSFGPDKAADLLHRFAYLYQPANRNTPKLEIPKRGQLRICFVKGRRWRRNRFRSAETHWWNSINGIYDAQQRDFGAVPLRDDLRVAQHAARLVGKIDGNKNMRNWLHYFASTPGAAGDCPIGRLIRLLRDGVTSE